MGAREYNRRRVGGWAPRPGIDEGSADFAELVRDFQAAVNDTIGAELVEVYNVARPPRLTVDGALGDDTVGVIVDCVNISRVGFGGYLAENWGAQWDATIFLPGEHNLPTDLPPAGGGGGEAPGGDPGPVDYGPELPPELPPAPSEDGGGGLGLALLALGLGLAFLGGD